MSTKCLTSPQKCWNWEKDDRYVEKFIKDSNDWNIFWRTRAEDGIEFVVGCLQLFSHKSRLTLSSGSITFCTFHVALLNVLEQQCRELTHSDKTVYPHHLVHFDAVDTWNPKIVRKNSYKRSNGVANSLISVLRAPHKSITFCLNNIKNCKFIWFDCETLKNHRFFRLFHKILNCCWYFWMRNLPTYEAWYKVLITT